MFEHKTWSGHMISQVLETVLPRLSDEVMQTENRLSPKLLPDRTVFAVWIPGCYSPHLCTNMSVFINIHDVIIHREYRRLVHISHSDL
jgi:hypothetical protein